MTLIWRSVLGVPRIACSHAMVPLTPSVLPESIIFTLVLLRFIRFNLQHGHHSAEALPRGIRPLRRRCDSVEWSEVRRE